MLKVCVHCVCVCVCVCVFVCVCVCVVMNASFSNVKANNTFQYDCIFSTYNLTLILIIYVSYYYYKIIVLVQFHS